MVTLYRLFVTVALLLFSITGFSQSLSINTDGSTANASAMLDIKSSTKGLLIPRLTKAEKNAVTAPATALLIYQTGPDSIGFYYYQNLRWNWLTDNKRNDSTYWGLHGNYNTTPPSAVNNTFIDFANDTYLGTPDFKDVSFIAGGNELMRLKQVPLSGRIGFTNRNPEYALDIRLSDPTPPSAIAGMRIIPGALYNTNNPVNIDKGLVIGSSVADMNETVFWNHANNVDGSIRLGFDVFNETIQPAVNITQFGEGIYQRNPKYALDIHSMSQFAPANQLTPKNGVRITYPSQVNQNDWGKGLFMGLLTNVPGVFKSYLWNYGGGQNGNSPDRAIYFGVGEDMSQFNHSATMELQDGKITMGHILSPDFFFPSTLNIQTDYASGVAKNGLSIMKNNTSQEAVYFGTDILDNLDIFNYNGAAKIFIGSTLATPLTINENNFVGIRTTTPSSDLQFADEYINNKLVLHNNLHGLGSNPHDFYGFGVNFGELRYQVPRNYASHIFYAGNGTGTASNELMRITGDGFVGINNSNPLAPLQFSDATANRKIVFTTVGGNNDHNFFGFGRTFGELRYQVMYNSDDHVFYAGDAGGFSSTELMRIKGNGNVGIGSIPFEKLTVAGNIRSTSLAGAVNHIAAADINGTLIPFASGTDGQVMAMVAGAPAWSSNSTWSTLGNPLTSPPLNFIGTTDGNDFAVRTSNVERIRVAAGGNVGIGTATPHALLQFANSVTNRKLVLYEGANNDHQYYGLGINGATFRYQVDATSSDHVFFAAATAASSNELMRIKGTGLVGIGTSAPTKQTEIIGAASAVPVTLVIGNRGGFGPAAMEFVSDYGLANQWRPGYMRSNDVGGFTGSLEFYTNGTGAGNLYGNVKGLEVRNGVTYTATGTVSSFSDERIKKNVSPFTSGLDVVSQINPVSYYYNVRSPFQTDKMQIGILAQDLEKVAPYMVDKNVTNNFEDLRSVNNQAYIFLLINSVKELQQQNIQQQKQIEYLMQKIK